MIIVLRDLMGRIVRYAHQMNTGMIGDGTRKAIGSHGQ